MAFSERRPRVLKVGGQELENESDLRALAAMVATLPDPLVIVHGGGRGIDALLSRLGAVPEKVDGLRRTDPATLEAVVMTLCGSARLGLVRVLQAAGRDAVGLSGVDGALLRCRPHARAAELGRVGTVTSVRVDLLDRLLAAGLTPVLSPVCLGEDHEVYNVNADDVAAAVAAALGAPRLDFLTDVPGVIVEGRPLASLDAADAARLRDSGAIQGGMMPKLNAAFEALRLGVPTVRLTDLAGLAAGTGTRLHS